MLIWTITENIWGGVRMGRKIICESCQTIFKEEVLGNASVCPVCGESLVDDEDSQEETLSFGEGIELGENDSFDEDKIDFWWYEIDEPEDEESSGLTFITCAKCGAHTSCLYPVARTGDYVLINHRIKRTCSKCGNELKNHIFSKRPADYIDPRQRDIWVKDHDNIPRCPICSSSQIHKISATNKVASAITLGIFAAGHVSKTFKCDTCGAKF